MATDIQVARLVTPLVAQTKQFTSGLGNALQVATSWGEKIKSAVVTKGLNLIVDAARVAGGAIINLGRELVNLVVTAAPLEGIGAAFDSMASRAGLSLESLRKAAAGTISDFDLMRNANVALVGSGDLLAQAMGQNLPRMLEIARSAARATGESVDFLFQSLVTGVKRSSPMLIDNTGLVLKVGEANAAMAASLGIAVSELSAEDKQVALLNATLAAGQRMVDEFGGGQATAAEQMAAFRAQIQNAKDQIGVGLLPVMSALLAPMSEIATGIGPKLVEWAEKAGDVLGTALPFAIDAVRNLLAGNFNTALSNARAAIATVFGPQAALTFNEWVGKIQEFLPKAIEAFDKVKGWIETNWPTVRDTVLEAVNKIKAFIDNDWPGIKDTIIDTFTEVKTWVETNWPGIRDSVLGVVDEIKAWFETNWPIIQAVVLTAFAVIESVVLAVVAVFQEQVLPAFQAVFDNITTIMDQFGISWADVWEAVKLAVGIVAAAIGAILIALVAVIVGVVTAVANVIAWWTSLWVNFVAAWTQIFTGLTQYVVGWWELLAGIFTGNGERIKAGFLAILEGIKNIWVGIFTAMVTVIQGTLGTIIVLVAGFIEGVIGFFTNLYQSLVGGSIVTDMLDQMLSLFTTILAEIVTTVSTWIGNVVSEITSRVSDFRSAGSDLMNGLKAGIIAKVSEIIAAVRKAVTDAIAAAKRVLGVESPSTVFAAIGRNMMGGLAMGVEQAAGVPIGVTAAASAAIARTSSMTINRTIHQTVNTRAETSTVIPDLQTAAGMIDAL